MPNKIVNNLFALSSGRRQKFIFALIIIISVAGFLVAGGKYYNQAVKKYSLPLPIVKEFPFRLGLDLLGGTQLVYQADVSQIPEADRESAVEGARDVIERRVNAFGVSEPNVQVNRTTAGDYRLLVELAGVKDINEAIKMIGETPLLEFKEEDEKKRELTEEEKKFLKDFNQQAEEKAQEVLGKVLSGGDFAALAKEFSQDEKTKDSGGDLGWLTEKDGGETINFVKKLQPGQIAPDLIKINNSWQILKLEEKREKTNPFDDKQKEKEINAAHILICFQEAVGCENKLTKDEALAKIKKIKAQATPANFAELAKNNSTDASSALAGGDLGWFDRNMMVKEFSDAAFALRNGEISEIVETQFGFHLIYKKAERVITEYRVRRIVFGLLSEEDILGQENNWKNTELTGRHLKRSSVQFDPNSGQPVVSLEFNSEGAAMFSEITGRNIGKKVAIFLDGRLISSPTVNEKISGGNAVISGRFNIKEAKELAARLNAGALPIPIHLVNQITIGASLGQQSLSASLQAGFVGFILVILFMILFYRLPGLLASFSLLVYILITLSFFKLLGVTLTLSGLAGFIISIGMAVDANVLIFSRLGEEIKKGRPFPLALEEAFRRAWPSIRDSNFFTIMTCIILITFSTSIVKGFAVTLLLGVLVSMFSAIFVTRNFLNLIPLGWLEKRPWLAASLAKNQDQ